MVLAPPNQESVYYQGLNLQIIQRGLKFLEGLEDFRPQQRFSFM
jgi:hypothetical protein